MTSLPVFKTFRRGVHPSEQKQLAADQPIEVFPPPATVKIPLLQHIGAPCDSLVKPRAKVTMGDAIAESSSPVSASCHASLSGTVTRAALATLPNGRHVPVIPIKNDAAQAPEGEVRQSFLFPDCPTSGLEEQEPETIVERVRAAGIVGMGGAAFPTHVKLAPAGGHKIDTLVINGAECEPYLTADYRLMLEVPRPIVAGALLAARAVGAERIAIAVEDNKPAAVGALREAARGTPVQVVELKTKYPQGGEKPLVLAVLGREVPTGGLPMHVGALVVNVATAAAIARAVLKGLPVTHRLVTVTGSAIGRPKNLLVPIGTSYRDLLEACGGLAPDAARVVAGGPMMGFTLGNLDVPVTKGTSGITVLSHTDVWRSEETTCVRCGRCVDVCPLRLVPTKIAMAARYGRSDLMNRYHAAACMECGCCAYECPASIPLVQLIRTGKVLLLKK